MLPPLSDHSVFSRLALYSECKDSFGTKAFAAISGGPVIINENTTPSLIYRFLGPGASDSQIESFLHLLRMNDIKDTNDVDSGLWAGLVSQALSAE